MFFLSLGVEGLSSLFGARRGGDSQEPVPFLSFVVQACKGCLRLVGPLMGSESIDEVFQKHLLEEGHLHYGEFINGLSRLIVSTDQRA